MTHRLPLSPELSCPLDGATLLFEPKEVSVKIVTVDIGGTRTRVARWERGALHDRRSFATGNLDELIATVRVVAPEGFDALGISFAGALDMRTGKILSAPNAKGWQELNLPDVLSHRMGCPVFLANDANCAALGELTAGCRAEDFVYVTWSTGIGGGLVSDGRVLWGNSGMAGEIGHTVIWPDGPPCACGKRGCLEAVAAGAGIARVAQEQLGQQLTAEEVISRAVRGDTSAQGIVADACRAMGQGLAVLSELLEPELLVLGGGITQSWAYLGPQVEHTLNDLARKPPPIRLTSLGDDIGLYGAAALPEHWPQRWKRAP